MNPLIGITCSVEKDDKGEERLSVKRYYADCVRAAGGDCIVIPPGANAERLAGLIDGLLIPGGGDFDGSLFGEPTHPEANPDSPERFETEKRLFESLPHDRPVLGICYGCQFLNIAHGGGIRQHLPDEIGENDHPGGTLQNYRLEPDSRLAGILGTEASGKSYHHQACGQIGKGLKAVGWTEDEVVEALEATNGRWLFGVQWHPERTPDNPATRSLFKKFVEAARR